MDIKEGLHWDEIAKPFSPEIMAEIAREEENMFQEVFYEYPGITDEWTLMYLRAHEHARQYQAFLDRKKREREAWENRYKVPQGLGKAELTKLLKETQKEIDHWLERTRDPSINEITKVFCDIVREEWVGKKTKIKSALKLHEGFGTERSLVKAKSYPIESLIDFNSGGFAKCLWHDEKTPSLKWYPKRNKAHCFGGCGDFDSIDAYQKINNVDFNEAVKALS